MRKLSAVCLAACAFAQLASAQWQLVSTKNESGPVAGVEHRHVGLRNATDGTEAALDLAIFSSDAARLRVIDNGGASQSLAQTMVRAQSLAGVNGGYFDVNFHPIGLRVTDGATTSPLKRAHLLTGVLCASARGIEIVRLGEFSRHHKLEAAVECGPFLVDSSRPVPSLEASRSARRTFAAVTRKKGGAALGLSSELTLAQLASALSDRSITSDFAVWRAMNLDGGSSSAFWFRRSDGSAFAIPEEKNVRDFVTVMGK